MEDLLRASLYPLLNDGRTSTLRKFLGFGHNHGLGGPVLALANAELAFMDGFHERSRRLAQAAGRELRSERSLATKAFCKAGQSAYFSDDPVGAVEHFQEARLVGGDEEDERRAIWGHFIASVELEEDRAIELLQEFEASGITSPEDRLRAQNGRLHVATRLGSLWEALQRSEGIATTVVQEARDPAVRASFWHAYAAALRVASIYPLALEATVRALSEVETFHLEFARAHINLARAGVFLATGRHAESLQLLDEVRAVARARGDMYVQMNECTLRCRLHLLEGDSEAAARVTDRDWSRIPSSGQYAEFLACRAIARYRSGEKASDVLARLEEARAASRENEASQLRAWGKALVLIHEHDEHANQAIRETFGEAWRKNVFDPFVFAYRLDPTLEHHLRSDPDAKKSLNLVLTRTRDARAGVNGASQAGLTPREREVLALIAESKSNREIASELYVTEATVKVHVRHILKKLGARTRTQAAIQAVTTRLLEESAAASQPTGPAEAEPRK
jgi:DNA-binding NarL/FixJ family response regulator